MYVFGWGAGAGVGFGVTGVGEEVGAGVFPGAPPVFPKFAVGAGSFWAGACGALVFPTTERATARITKIPTTVPIVLLLFMCVDYIKNRVDFTPTRYMTTRSMSRYDHYPHPVLI